MQVEQVVSILDSLGAGAPPELLQSEEVRQALRVASDLLRQRPAAAGARWTEEEDAQLLTAFDAGTPLPEIARTHHRSRGAITLRLVKHGRIDADVVKPRQRV